MSKYTFEIPGPDDEQTKPLKVEALFFNNSPQFPALFVDRSSFVRVDGSDGAVQVYSRATHAWVTVGYLRVSAHGATVELVERSEE